MGGVFSCQAQTLALPGMTPGMAMHPCLPTPRGCSDGAIRRPGGRPLPGWRSGVARAGGRSSWRTRCGCGDKHSIGPGRGAVKRLNGPMAMMPQAPSAWAIAVGLSSLTLRGKRDELRGRARAGRTYRSVCRTNGLRKFDDRTVAERSVTFPCFSWEFSVAAVVGASHKQAKRCSH
jgi:hypothetical protein